MKNDVLLVGQIYINNIRDLEIYEFNTKNNKNFGYDILIVDSSKSKFKFDYTLADYYMYDKKNLLFNRNPFDFINFYYFHMNIQLNIFCSNSSPHELNILYQNTKAFNFAKSLGYKYILRVESDLEFTSKDIEEINKKIDECKSFNKKAIFMKIDDTYIGFHISFWNIDYYFEKIGEIFSQKDWENLLKKYNIIDEGLEKTIPKIINNEEDFLKFDDLHSEPQKGFRYKETKMYFDSDCIIDFFKSEDNNVYFATANNSKDKFPNKLILTQYTQNGILKNEIVDLGETVSWVLIDTNIKNVELEVNDNIYTLTKEDLMNKPNTIIFK